MKEHEILDCQKWQFIDIYIMSEMSVIKVSFLVFKHFKCMDIQLALHALNNLL